MTAWLIAILAAVLIGAALWRSLALRVWVLRKIFGGPGPGRGPADLESRKAALSVRRDLIYPSPHGDGRYDLYLPAGEGPFPVVVWIHGGAFVAGDKANVANWAVMLAYAGYAVAALNYCWAPELTFPGQARQIQAAMAALKAHPQLDLTRTALAGDSAGAYLALQAGLITVNPAFAAALEVPPALPPEALKALVLCCGCYRLIPHGRDLASRLLGRSVGWALFGRRDWMSLPAAPLTDLIGRVTGGLPPCYIADGNTGSFEADGRALAAALEQAGVPAVTRFYGREAGAVGHEYQFDLLTPQGVETWEEALEFLHKSLP